MDSEEVSATDAAGLLGLDRSTVVRWCQTSVVTATRKPGPRGDWLIPRSEIDRLIAEAASR